MKKGDFHPLFLYPMHVLPLTDPHEVINKIDQKQQLSKKPIHARLIPRHCT